MISLSYHPCFDAFHGIFRIIRLFQGLQTTYMEVDKYRILDYYLLFPWRAADVRLARPDVSLRAIAKALDKKKDYATLPEGAVLLERMRPSQQAALQTMANDGAIDTDALFQGVAKLTERIIPQNLHDLAKKKNEENAAVIGIVSALARYPVLGIEGLKARTSLLEHRYDNV